MSPEPRTPTFWIFFMPSLLSGMCLEICRFYDLPPFPLPFEDEPQSPRHAERQPLGPLHDLDPGTGQQLLEPQGGGLLRAQAVEVDVDEPARMLSDQGVRRRLHLAGIDPQSFADPPRQDGLAAPQLAREEQHAIRGQLPDQLAAQGPGLLFGAGPPAPQGRRLPTGHRPWPLSGP